MTQWPKSISLRSFPELSLTQSLRLARDAGFDAIEVNLEPGWFFTLDSSDADIRGLATIIADHRLAVSTVYSREQWHYPMTSADRAIAARGRDIVSRLAEAAEIVGAGAVLVVPGAVDNGVMAPRREIVPYDVAYDRAQAAMADLAAENTRANRSCVLCVENVWNKFLLSPLEMRRFVDEIASPSLGVYFDVGNVLLYGYPEQWIRILGPRIRRVHLKDFRSRVGTIDGFTGLFQGDADWPEIMRALVETGYDSYLTAEVLPAYRHFGERLVHECAGAIDALRNSVAPAAVWTTRSTSLSP